MSFALQRLQTPARSAQEVPATTLTTFSGRMVGIIPDADGTLTATLADDAADVTIAVTGGVFYPLSLASVPAGNAVAFTALFV